MNDSVAPDDVLAGRVIRIVVKATRIDAGRVTVDSTFQDLGVDSLEALNIVFMLEDEFGITISDEDSRGITSIRQIVARLGPLVGELRAGNREA